MSEKSEVFSGSLGKENIVNCIVQFITDKIISGELKPGDKLPIESELCQAFGVGRNSVREAIKILCAYGVVYIKRSEGTFINDKYSHKMLDPMLYGMLLQKNFTKDVVMLREVLDIGILHTAMNDMTEEQMKGLLVQLEKLVDIIKQPNPDLEEIFNIDMAFHTEITNSIENEMLSGIYAYVDRITKHTRKKAIKLVLDSNKQEEFVVLHQKIITAIEKKAFGEIKNIFTEHYQFWSQSVS